MFLVNMHEAKYRCEVGANRATRLPLIHNVGAELLLIAVATEHPFTLVTPDPVISQ